MHSGSGYSGQVWTKTVVQRSGVQSTGGGLEPGLEGESGAALPAGD